ncbi:hypothetical protein [Phaeodactylibacter luteus]|uniref:Uncharacterized protein n=1 Tax=Phaeodactylibacter luteus TaxID=1564516 RepID=A0A5C6S2P8_9BACT|nr:hypothetical protein [Phaeodactylibacter luteus]TXB68899.1 hypothetical protein FRY97_02190 [Phaeodactylibacter luteus]
MRIRLGTFIAVAIALACAPIDNRQPPGSEDVFAVRDSIRNVLLLRLGEAKQAINRRSEMLERKAYSVGSREAKALRAEAAQLEKYYQQLNARSQVLEQDSILGQWFSQQGALEVELLEVSQALGQPF